MSDTAAVTRLEVLAAVDRAFRHGHHPSRAEMLDAAVAFGARSEVSDLLGRLPKGRLTVPWELWNHLPDVPLGD